MPWFFALGAAGGGGGGGGGGDGGDGSDDSRSSSSNCRARCLHKQYLGSLPMAAYEFVQIEPHAGTGVGAAGAGTAVDVKATPGGIACTATQDKVPGGERSKL